MGDTTYNHIYYDTGSTGTVTQSLRHHVKAKQDPEDAFKPYQANLQPVASASQQPLPTQASQGQRWSYSPSEQPLPNQDQTQQPLGGQASQARGRTPSPAEVPLPVQATAEAGAAAGVYPQDAPAAAMQSPGLAPAADTPTGGQTQHSVFCMLSLSQEHLCLSYCAATLAVNDVWNESGAQFF